MTQKPKNIPPEEWRRRLKLLPAPQRIAVARIVWWDHFAERLFSERWPHLDGMIKHRDEVPDDVLVDGLVAVGYERAHAVSRITNKVVVRSHKRINARGRRRFYLLRRAGLVKTRSHETGAPFKVLPENS